jgi:TRAP-type C4-dicarboxylate transport system substrate-binding protein
MPMGEVYSALAKGVLDGVLAPPDALKSLHFGEVAKHFNTIPIPRGAYAARAMGLKRWQSLTPEQQHLLQRSEAIWEQALSVELKKANLAGEQAGHEQKMQFTSMPDADQQRFFEIYNRIAERSAGNLKQHDIDGLPTYRYARQVAEQLRTDHTLECASIPKRESAASIKAFEIPSSRTTMNTQNQNVPTNKDRAHG